MLTLPTELLENILSYLTFTDLMKCREVSKIFHLDDKRAKVLKEINKKSNNKRELLSYIAIIGDINLVSRVVNKCNEGMILNAVSTASLAGHLPIVTMLLAKITKLRLRYRSIINGLKMACRISHYDIILFFIHEGPYRWIKLVDMKTIYPHHVLKWCDDFWKTLCRETVKYGNVCSIQWLLDLSASLDGFDLGQSIDYLYHIVNTKRSNLRYQDEKSYAERFHMLLKRGFNKYIHSEIKRGLNKYFYYCVYRKRTDIIEYMINKRIADISSGFICAVKIGNDMIIDMFMAKINDTGFLNLQNIDKTDIDFSLQDNFIKCGLKGAVISGRVHLVNKFYQMLPIHPDTINRCLYLAVKVGNLNMVRHFVDMGGDCFGDLLRIANPIIKRYLLTFKGNVINHYWREECDRSFIRWNG